MRHKAEAIRVINNSCQVTKTFYRHSSKGTCAIGGLALAAGLSVEDLCGKTSFWAIEKYFGLSPDQQAKIMRLNDMVKRYDNSDNSIAERRELVIWYLQQLPDEDLPVTPIACENHHQLDQAGADVPDLGGYQEEDCVRQDDRDLVLA